ncbi:hypothetical protein NDU88_005231 [Pleurodeles waltl]|uniref:Uncharacterized protein n=1 Tax=Pleurodeles waltl TaxID=8319 RepID=A0AAV7WCR9_PLEWA|nr:hypothetical protein NDU88_005231 [Pleurodeles waltl]
MQGVEAQDDDFLDDAYMNQEGNYMNKYVLDSHQDDVGEDDLYVQHPELTGEKCRRPEDTGLRQTVLKEPPVQKRVPANHTACFRKRAAVRAFCKRVATLLFQPFLIWLFFTPRFLERKRIFRRRLLYNVVD